MSGWNVTCRERKPQAGQISNRAMGLRAIPEFLGADPADIARALAPHLHLPILAHLRALIVALLDISGLADADTLAIVEPELDRAAAGVAILVGGLDSNESRSAQVGPSCSRAALRQRMVLEVAAYIFHIDPTAGDADQGRPRQQSVDRKTNVLRVRYSVRIQIHRTEPGACRPLQVGPNGGLEIAAINLIVAVGVQRRAADCKSVVQRRLQRYGRTRTSHLSGRARKEPRPAA